MSDAEWREALLRTRGALASVDFVEPEPNYPEPIEPLFPDESPA